MVCIHDYERFARPAEGEGIVHIRVKVCIMLVTYASSVCGKSWYPTRHPAIRVTSTHQAEQHCTINHLATYMASPLSVMSCGLVRSGDLGRATSSCMVAECCLMALTGAHRLKHPGAYTTAENLRLFVCHYKFALEVSLFKRGWGCCTDDRATEARRPENRLGTPPRATAALPRSKLGVLRESSACTRANEACPVTPLFLMQHARFICRTRRKAEASAWLLMRRREIHFLAIIMQTHARARVLISCEGQTRYY